MFKRWTALYPVESAVGFLNSCIPDTDLSDVLRYPVFKQLGPGHLVGEPGNSFKQISVFNG